MKRVLQIAASVVGAAVVFLACSSNVEPRRGGLVLTVANDGSLQLDQLKVQVSSGDKVLLQNEFAVPDTPLPNTLSIVSNGSGTTTATITVSAWLGGVVVDRRDAIVTQIPVDRVASLGIVLSGRCTMFVKAGADPTTGESTCPAGQTCDPTGAVAHCTSASVDASGLPDFNNGASAGDSGTGGGSGNPGPDAASTVCAEGALQCTALQPQDCAQGQWRDKGAACPYACQNGACTGECTPGTAKCSPGGVMTCGADAMWGAPTACPASTPSCNGAGLCGTCTAGTKQCSDTGTQTCSAVGEWGPSTACDAATPFCNGAGVCGVCKMLDSRCVGNSTEVCAADGTWGVATACKNACVSGACTGICAPNATQCIGTTQQTCSAVGSWVNDPVVMNTCGAACTPAATRCNGAVPQTCNAVGSWQSGSVMSGQCGAICAPGQTKCVSTDTSTCTSSGTWGPNVITVGSCGAVCNPTSQRCVNPYLETCTSAGTWDSGVVVANQCGAVCTPGAKGCLNTEQNGGAFCSGTGCWWVWSNETVYDKTCNSVGQWGPQNLCTGKCVHPTNGMTYYNCDGGNGGCIPNGAVCSSS